MNARNPEHSTPTSHAASAEPKPDDAIFRVDMFDCPAEHAALFKTRLSMIHGYFDTLPGCLYNRVAIRAAKAGDRTVRIVTMVEWRDRHCLEEARTVVGGLYAQAGFDPSAFMADHGIRGDFGVYLPLEA